MASYYEVLGVDPDVDDARIHDAYVEAMRAASEHGQGPEVRRLDEAYAVIGDPERRRRYDELRAAEGARGNAELLALLAVIAETGGIPAGQDVVTPPAPDAIAAPGEEPKPTGATDQPADERPAEHAPRAEERPAQERPAEEPPLAEERPGEAARSAGGARAGAATDRRPAPAPPVSARTTGQASEARAAPRADGGTTQPGRRRTIVALIAAAAVVGILAGLVYADRTPEPAALGVGGCVALTDQHATAVPCDDERADARITAIVDSPAECTPSPLGTLVLRERTACLEAIGSPAP